ncbi:hypothetical protein ABIA24_003377 [Sinorhizobium fredii]|uniref:hypothetical protein n=1 Tax=Rhizobium fredii TaxID=380 RepID=UPI003515BC6A
MQFDRSFSADLIGPDELDMLDFVFKSELRKRRLSRRSEEAERLAAKLIGLYQSGLRDAPELSTAVAACYPHRHTALRFSKNHSSR